MKYRFFFVLPRTIRKRWLRVIFWAVLVCGPGIHGFSDNFRGRDILREISADPDFVNLSSLPHVKVDLRYASKNNFAGKDLYGGFDQAFLQKVAARKLARAAEWIHSLKPGWKIVVFDALRPQRVQKRLWAEVRGTPQEKYIANPQRASVHNFGLAVDVSLIDADGRLVDMGTPYDSFIQLSEPRLEAQFVKNGKLSRTHRANRNLLRRVMTEAGFTQAPVEWWHFNACSIQEARRSYRLVK